MKTIKAALTFLLAAVMILTLSACKANYKWTTDKLPKPSARKGEVYETSAYGVFGANIECSESYYEKYIDQCRESGFNAEEYFSSIDGTFLYHSDGSRVWLHYYSGIMSISLTPPITLDNDEWPDNSAAKQVPKPKSTRFGKYPGAANDRNEKAFSIYVGDTSHDDFLDYIKQCKEAGFDDVAYEEPTAFEASNGTFELMSSYDGVNVISIRVFPSRTAQN